MTERLLRGTLIAVLVAGTWVTLFLHDPQSLHVFREPPMLALAAFGGLAALVWGTWVITAAGAARTPPRIPRALLLLGSLAPVLLVRLFLDLKEPSLDLAVGGINPILSYRLHVLLPVLSWLLVACSASLAFCSTQSRSLLALAVLLGLGLETGIVVTEMVGNRLGISLNPVAAWSEIDLMDQRVKEAVYGTIGNPNFVAGYLAIAFFPALGWTLGRRGPFRKILGLTVLGAVMVSIVATRSKGGFLALAAGALHFLLCLRLTGGQRGGTNRSAAWMRPLVAGALVLALVLAGWLFADVLSPSEEGPYLGRWLETLSLKGDSIAVRALLWVSGFRLWEANPWLGIGPGEFKIRFLGVLRGMVEGPDSDLFAGRVARLHSLRANHLHNEFLQALVEWGVLGFLGILLFLVCAQVRAFGLIHTGACRRDRLIRLGFLSGWWSALGGSLFDLPFHRPAQAYLLAVLLGAALSEGGLLRSVPLRSLFTRARGAFLSLSLLALGVGMLWMADIRYVSLREAAMAREILSGKIPGGDSRKAEAAIRRVASRVPGEGDYQVLFALALLNRGDYNAAISSIRRAKAVSDDPELLLLEARAQIEKGNMAAAAPLLAFFEALDRDRPGLHYLKGRVAEGLGNPDAARQSFLADIHFSGLSPDLANPDLPDSHLRLARLLEARGEFREAARHYRGFLEALGGRRPDFPMAELALARIYRDRLFDPALARKYFEEARETFKKQGNHAELERLAAELASLPNRTEE
ncbi:MAG: hypothetical protein GHCLOJNM_02558 [bacterium]|nr:hypothetical protein [bacterium]